MKLYNSLSNQAATKSLKYYSSKDCFTGGQTVRQWLSTQSYQAQYDFEM